MNLLCYGLEGDVKLEKSCSYCHGVIDVFLVVVHLGEYNRPQSENKHLLLSRRFNFYLCKVKELLLKAGPRAEAKVLKLLVVTLCINET